MDTILRLCIQDSDFTVRILTNIERSIIVLLESRSPVNNIIPLFYKPGDIAFNKFCTLVYNNTIYSSNSQKEVILQKYIFATNILQCTIDNEHPFDIVDRIFNVL